MLLTVGLTGLVAPKDVFAGFSNSAVITVWAVYIVSVGLFRTGVVDVMGRLILRLAGSNEIRLIAVIMVTCGLMSAFMNNVGATAMLLPAVVSISRQTKIPVSKLLIPLSFSSLMGGGLTLIGTPANILAADIVTEHGLPTFGFFDFTPMGLIVFGAGILYMLFFGRHLLPVRQSPDQMKSFRQLRPYMGEARILPDSKLVNKTLFESRLGADYNVTVVNILRDNLKKTTIHRNTIIQSNDILLIEGSVEKS